MRRIVKVMLLSAAIGVTCAQMAPIAHAQEAKEAPPAPLPAQIYSWKKVFIANAGGDSNDLYSGGPNRLYNQFYAALKSWGRYELTGSPAEADLVFEISFTNPYVGEQVSGGGGQIPVSNRSFNDPQFRLTILDPATRVTLWIFTRHVEHALLKSNRDKNFDQAVANLANDLRDIPGQPTAVAVGPKK